MPVTINGTTGIAGVDGSAGTPAVQGADSNTGIFFPAADTIAFAEGGAEVARFDSSGNFGLGVTPSAWSGGYVGFQVKDAAFASFSSGYTWVGNNWYNNSGNKYIANGTATLYEQNGGAHKWFYAASGTAGNTISFTQAMTLDSSGNLLVGTTSSAGRITVLADSGNNVAAFRSAGAVSATRFARFDVNTSTEVGSIQYNGTGTSYVTTSDYRLKENIAPMTGALAKVALLKPCSYTWKSNGERDEGFIAHELAEVCPRAVSGEKDAVNEDGSIKPQGIDTSFLVATLTAAIQEQQALINDLTARIAALEAA